MSSYTINKSKTAEIYKDKDSTSSWHNFLSLAIDADGKALGESQRSFIAGDFLSAGYIVDPKVELYLEETLPENLLKTYNNYDKVIAGSLPGLNNKTVQNIANIAELGLQAVSGATGGTGFSIDPWIANMKTWKGLKGADMQFDYKFHFRMGQYGLWNAKEEVVKPILSLMAPTMIRQIGWVIVEGPYPTTGAILGNLINELSGKGLDLFTDFSKGFVDGLQGVVSSLYNNSFGNTLYTVRLGNYTLENVLIEDSTIQWSQETDQYHFPIAGDISLTFSVPFPATMYVNGTSHPHSVKFSPPVSSS